MLWTQPPGAASLRGRDRAGSTYLGVLFTSRSLEGPHGGAGMPRCPTSLSTLLLRALPFLMATCCLSPLPQGLQGYVYSPIDLLVLISFPQVLNLSPSLGNHSVSPSVISPMRRCSLAFSPHVTSAHQTHLCRLSAASSTH